jgi:uncharacterized membrane protein
MSKIYNRFAGQSPERLAALSDGIFAVAMTLLVLNLHPPDLGNLIKTEQFLWQGNTLQKEGALLAALGPLGLNLVPYIMSFLTLGIFWVGQQTQLNLFKRTDRDLAWIHLGFLFAVSLMPFSTSFLAAFINYRVALVIYWLNILLLGAMLLVSWKYAERAGLVPENMTAKLRSAIIRRIVVAQVLYAFGALLCIINTYVSIVVIVLVQLNYAIAPRIRALYRL